MVLVPEFTNEIHAQICECQIALVQVSRHLLNCRFIDLKEWLVRRIVPNSAENIKKLIRGILNGPDLMKDKQFGRVWESPMVRSNLSTILALCPQKGLDQKLQEAIRYQNDRSIIVFNAR